jgi:hypothetical protein
MQTGFKIFVAITMFSLPTVMVGRLSLLRRLIARLAERARLNDGAWLARVREFTQPTAQGGR